MVLIAAMNSCLDFKGDIFNIGTGRNYTIQELVSIIGGLGYLTETLPERKGEARHTKADNSKAKELLGWEPKVKLEDWIGNND